MKIHYETADARLFVELAGELDHHSMGSLRTEVDEAIFIHNPHELILDFGQVTFMDSSGIGLIMGRYRILHPLGGRIILLRPAPHIRSILRLAGMEQLASIKNELEQEVAQ